jgi:hypothetical protein
MLVLFNKDKQFIGFSPDLPQEALENFYTKEVPESQADFTKWRWDGDYESGRMVSIVEDGYPIEELELERQLFEKIDQKYPLGVQLVNIIRQLKLLSNEGEADYRFTDMADTILDAVEKHDSRIKYYQSRNKLLNKEDAQQQFTNTFGK